MMTFVHFVHILWGIQGAAALPTLSATFSFTSTSRIRQPVTSIASLLQLKISKETEVEFVPGEEGRGERRVSRAGLSARKEAVEDDLDFERRVKDQKFLERNKRWVVLVDDEEAIRLAVGDYLYDQGYQITACADADAFLEVCQNFQTIDDTASPLQQQQQQQQQQQTPATTIKVPDAIVSDVRMPGKDGLELLRLIRADERLSRVPVILLTAKGLAADRIAGYKAGANVYLPKPFAPEELLSILDNSIRRRQQMTNRQAGSLIDLKQELTDIKEIMKANGNNVVKRTNVYLTLVEREVLDLLCQGLTNKEIADERGVNVIGINKMISKLYKITETQTRTELVRWAMQTGYVSKR